MAVDHLGGDVNALSITRSDCLFGAGIPFPVGVPFDRRNRDSYARATVVA